MSSEPEHSKRTAWLEAIIDHPYITAFMLLCMVAGIVVAIDQLPTEWSLARRATSGAFSGISIGLIITANRMLGAWR